MKLKIHLPFSELAGIGLLQDWVLKMCLAALLEIKVPPF